MNAGRSVVSPVRSGDLSWDEVAASDPALAEWCADRWLGAYRRLGPAPATFVHVRVQGASLVAQDVTGERSAPITTLAAAADHIGPDLLPDDVARRSVRFRMVAVHAEPGDAALIDALRSGDERAFARLVDSHHSSLLRVARLYVRDRAVAEEVVQETWLAVLEGIDRFEARSSVKTWIYRILTNRAKTRASREHRQLPFSALGQDDEPEVDEKRFLPIDDPRYPQHWAVPPRAWPDERILARETVEQIRSAIAQLPAVQQVIVGLRDVDGWSSEEVCQALEITPSNQRVLLHRGRSRLRNALEGYFEAA